MNFSLKSLILKSIIRIVAVFLFYVIIVSCKTEKKSTIESSDMKEKRDVIEVVTNHMDFQMVDTISSGWHTFKYINNSDETHLFLFDKYPEGKTIKDTEKEVGPSFQKGMDLIIEGKPEEGYAAFNQLPAWFFEVVFSGGSGLVSPKTTNEIIVNLEPGYYLVECYVKMQNGMFHSSMGMVKELIVTNERSSEAPPTPNVRIQISGDNGISLMDSIQKGKQIFEVFYKDQKAHENFLGHDVNVVKLEKDSDLQVLEEWINWVNPAGLISPAPEGFTFLGGLNDMPKGSTGYFILDLEPGRYALISEVPNSSSKNMLKIVNIK